MFIYLLWACCIVAPLNAASTQPGKKPSQTVAITQHGTPELDLLAMSPLVARNATLQPAPTPPREIVTALATSLGKAGFSAPLLTQRPPQKTPSASPIASDDEGYFEPPRCPDDEINPWDELDL
jgi:hypothetical protein